MKKVTVDAEVLNQILYAFKGPPHLAQELWATLKLPENPVNKLMREYEKANSGAPKTSQEPPAKHSSWRHHNGNLYRVIDVANLHSEDHKYPATVHYMDQKGRTWSRSLDDWHKSMTFVKQLDAVAPPLGYIPRGSISRETGELSVEGTVLRKEPGVLDRGIPVWVAPVAPRTAAQRWLISRCNDLGMKGHDLQGVHQFVEQLAERKYISDKVFKELRRVVMRSPEGSPSLAANMQSAAVVLEWIEEQPIKENRP